MKCARLISYKSMLFFWDYNPYIYRFCLVGKWALTITLNLQIYYRSEYISFSNKSQKSAVSSPSQTYRRGTPLLNISKGSPDSGKLKRWLIPHFEDAHLPSLVHMSHPRSQTPHTALHAGLSAHRNFARLPVRRATSVHTITVIKRQTFRSTL